MLLINKETFQCGVNRKFETIVFLFWIVLYCHISNVIMRTTNNYLYVLFIVAFIFLTMCPTVHEFGENVRHDVVLKGAAKIIQKVLQKGANTTPSPAFHNIYTDFRFQSGTAQGFLYSLASHSSLNLIILSSVQLILWYAFISSLLITYSFAPVI